MRFFCAVLFIVALSSNGFAQEAPSPIERINSFFNGLNLQTHGSLKNETAARIRTPKEFTKLRNQLILAESGKLSENTTFKVSGRFWYDAVYDGTDNYPENVESDQEYLYELRDTYLDYSNGPFDVRLGKQQIVWGEAVGLFFADVVNAKDLREFVLPDFDMIRIPDWGMDLEYGKDNFHAEFIWLPAPQFNKYGVIGSEFAYPFPLPPNTSFTYVDPLEPKDSFNNGEAGVRLSYLINGWDVSGFYLYTWDKTPVMYRTINANVFDFHPGYKRLNIIGTTFSKELSDAVVKGEFVYNHKGNFSLFDANDSDGIIRRDFLEYVLGVDYTFFGKIDTNLQFMQRVIFGYDKRIVNERHVRNAVSLRIDKGFLNNALDAEFFIIAGLETLDLMCRPRLTYTFQNNWKFRVGLDIFDGRASGIFGKFDRKSRAYAELTYSF